MFAENLRIPTVTRRGGSGPISAVVRCQWSASPATIATPSRSVRAELSSPMVRSPSETQRQPAAPICFRRLLRMRPLLDHVR